MMPQDEDPIYDERDIVALGKHYTDHVAAMTTHGLHEKSDIAAELAHRDREIERWNGAYYDAQHQLGEALDRLDRCEKKLTKADGLLQQCGDWFCQNETKLRNAGIGGFRVIGDEDRAVEEQETCRNCGNPASPITTVARKDGKPICADCFYVPIEAPVCIGFDMASGPDQTFYRCHNCKGVFDAPLAHECRVVQGLEALAAREVHRDALRDELTGVTDMHKGRDDVQEPCPHKHTAVREVSGETYCDDCGRVVEKQLPECGATCEPYIHRFGQHGVCVRPAGHDGPHSAYSEIVSEGRIP